MIKKDRLFTPGPTALHPDVLAALAKPIPHHRTEEFRDVFRASLLGLRSFFKAEEVLVLAASGTGAMEAAVVNLLSPGDPMLVLVAGSFGERWAGIGRAHGMQVQALEAPWGEAVAPEAVARALEGQPSIRAVFVQLSESSTGAAHDVEAIARIVRARPGTLLAVDAISGAGAIPLDASGWGVDLVVGGSQKALALPPGLAFVALSSRAWERIAATKAPRFYFDLSRERKSQAQGESAFTPAISNVVSLKAALDFVAALGGVDALVANARCLASMTRAAAAALGLPLVSPSHHGDALTALLPPAGIDSGAIVKGLKREFAATIAGGQGQLQGKIFRVAHLGYYDAMDALGLIASLEIVLRRLGHAIELGRGVAAAQQAYLGRGPGAPA